MTKTLEEKRKKLLFIVNVDWFFVSHRLPIAIAAISNGYEVHVATAVTKYEKFFYDNGIHLHSLNLKRSVINPFSNYLSLIEIYNIIKSVNPGILHLITIKPILIGGIAAFLLKLFSGREVLLVSSFTGVGYPFTSNSIKAIALKLIISNLYKISFLHKNKCLIFQNKDDLKLISSIINLKRHEYVLIPGSGVNLHEYSYAPIPQGKPIIMFGARLLKSKGIFEFVEAAKNVSGCRFVIVGKIDHNNRDCISSSQLNKWVSEQLIEYWGYSNSMHETIKKCSIFVLPSYKEGFPKVLIEASASGRPIITTDITGCRDAIEENITGLLVPVKDSRSLGIQINYLLKNTNLMIKMGKAGRDLAEKKYDIKSVIKKHLEIYDYPSKF